MIGTEKMNWYRGLTKEEIVKKYPKWINCGFKKGNKICLGRIPWNKELTKKTDIKLKKISERMKGDKNPAKRPEVGRKISKKLKGRKLSCGTTNKKFPEDKYPNFGKRGKEGLIGDKNPAWQGGISFEPYGLEFNKELREFIRKRDNYKCQNCFKVQSQLRRLLCIHHIDYNKKNNNTINLISLCNNCHMKTNFNRELWQRYFQLYQKYRFSKFIIYKLISFIKFKFLKNTM